MPSGEDGLVLRVKDSDGGLGEDDGAVSITERNNINEGVCEAQEDVAIRGGCGELWECDSACSSRLLDLTRSSTNTDRGRGWVDVITRVTFSQVDTAGSTINYSSVNERNWGRYGRL